jgi:RNA ligase (TIGR02306 family)
MENLNSVCYVGLVTEIKEIKGADFLELALIGGWNCVTKKNEFQTGDKIVVATTDAVIPAALSDLMGVTTYLRKGNRVRTVKLRGVYSECLLIPFKYLAPQSLEKNCPVGTDMMSILGVTKYEPPVRQIQLAGGRKIKYQDNQNFHVYYKFPNLKNVDGMFNETDEVQITRKIHGTNARFGIVRKNKLSIWDRIKKYLKLPGHKFVEYEYVYGSHNVEKGSDSQGFYSTDVWSNAANKYKIKESLWEYAKNMYVSIGEGIVIYGEIYGAGIQKNYEYGLTETRFVAFDIKRNGEYLSPLTTEFLINKEFGIPHVEVLYTGLWSQSVQDKFTFKNFIKETKVPHEGIVIKYHTGERNKIAKVINPDYLCYSEANDVEDSH